MFSCSISSSKRGKKRKIKGKKKGSSTLSPWKSLQLEDERPFSSAGCAPRVATASLSALCDQNRNPWSGRDRLLIAHPGSYTLCVSCSPLPAIGVWGWLDAAAVLKGWKWLKSSTVYHPDLPLEVEAFSRLQSSKTVISDRFCQCNCCLGGETDSWCIPFYHLPRFLSV